MERFFFLDDADRELVAAHRGAHSQLGFAVQPVTIRCSVRDVDAARLSVYQHAHYPFVLPDLAGGRRPLRNPDVAPHV